MRKAPFNEGLFGGIEGLLKSLTWRRWFNDLLVWITDASGSPNLDGGTADSIYGGITPIDGGAS